MEDSQIGLMLGRLEGKLDMLIGSNVSLEKRQTATDERIDKLLTRVDALEAQRDRNVGAITTVKAVWLVAAALAGMAMTYLKSFVFR